jgi:hypothetical protein
MIQVMKRATRYHLHSSVSEGRTRVHVRHVAAASLINGQEH